MRQEALGLAPDDLQIPAALPPRPWSIAHATIESFRMRSAIAFRQDARQLC
jgi:hypothetical protein